MALKDFSTSFYQARLMSPNDVRGAIYGQNQVIPDNFVQSWCLCGDVCDEFYKRVLAGRPICYGIMLFSVVQETFYAGFTLQIDEYQVRFLLPLGSDKCERFFEQVERTGLNISLGQAGKSNALLLAFELASGSRELIERCLAKSRLVRGNIEPVQMKMAIDMVSDIEAVPSVYRYLLVENITVNIVIS